MLKFGQRVHQARVEKRLTLDAVAKAIRSHKGYVSGIENDKVNPPSPKVVARICAKLELPFEEMLALGFWEKRPKGVTTQVMFDLLAKLRQEQPVGGGPAPQVLTMAPVSEKAVG